MHSFSFYLAFIEHVDKIEIVAKPTITVYDEYPYGCKVKEMIILDKPDTKIIEDILFKIVQRNKNLS